MLLIFLTDSKSLLSQLIIESSTTKNAQSQCNVLPLASYDVFYRLIFKIVRFDLNFTTLICCHICYISWQRRICVKIKDEEDERRKYWSGFKLPLTPGQEA